MFTVIFAGFPNIAFPIVITVKPFSSPTFEPDVDIKSELSFIISVYIESYFLTLSFCSFNAFSIKLVVIIFDFDIFAQVDASPITSKISLNKVDILV